MLLTSSGNMCSIFGSTKLDDIRKLLELNKSRGGYSWSFAAFEYWDGELRLPALYKAIGSFPLDLFDDPPVGDYYLGAYTDTYGRQSWIGKSPPRCYRARENKR